MPDKSYLQKLASLLPHFEAKEKATYNRVGFMKKLENIMYEHDLFTKNYPSRLDEIGGWDMLEDISFAEGCDMEACWTLLSAAIRSERTSMEEGYVWQKHIDSGLFTTLLRRITAAA